jgi:hypothetical protein
MLNPIQFRKVILGMVAALGVSMSLQFMASAAVAPDTSLHTQFPGNTLFPLEIARLTPSVTSAH